MITTIGNNKYDKKLENYPKLLSEFEKKNTKSRSKNFKTTMRDRKKTKKLQSQPKNNDQTLITTRNDGHKLVKYKKNTIKMWKYYKCD